jgi:predicted pyridoxine 5'-phosphate oxidase superfamily flavin-nucleotide-binding protein
LAGTTIRGKMSEDMRDKIDRVAGARRGMLKGQGMATHPLYHEGSRELQDRFGSRALADRLTEVTLRAAFTDADKAFIESLPMFFLATADAQGRPDCSYKGGAPGFVRVVDRHTLAFPSYDGNGMFKSLGNVLVNPRVGLLFIDFQGPRRLRVTGRASLDENDPLREEFVGAQLMVRVRAEAIFPNCPRYIHRMQLVEQSVYTPCEGVEPPEPAWKGFAEFRDVVPKRRP